MLKWILNHKFLLLWLLLSAAIGGYYYQLFFMSENKTALLPGRTTSGHHQIEMECAACHTEEKKKNVFTSSGVPSSACMSCHGEALAKFSDSHPTRKFKNPENIIFTSKIDALNCITCHSEHNPKVTSTMGVTIPPDYCAHCHEVTRESLDSHKNLTYDPCHTAGCHNYHDNTDLAPSFLLKHYGEQKMLSEVKKRPLASDQPCPDKWTTGESCASCHSDHMHEFKQGKHGMRLAFPNLSPLVPEMARIPMRNSAAHLKMDCMACHQPEKPRAFASYNACVQCHDDNHTRNYDKSKHFTIWDATKGQGGVSCASCHMPRIENEGGGYHVNHDNSANLRPNEKMLRSVCNDCHGMQFSMDALADPKLIESNFQSSPTQAHPGIKWTADAAIKRGDVKTKEIRDYLEKLSKQ